MDRKGKSIYIYIRIDTVVHVQYIVYSGQEKNGTYGYIWNNGCVICTMVRCIIMYNFCAHCGCISVDTHDYTYMIIIIHNI